MRVTAFRRGDLLPQSRAITQHRRDTEFGILLRVNGRRMNEQNGAGVFVDDIADTVVQKLRLADLRRGYHDDVPHLWVCESVHRLAQIGCALRTPRAGFGRTLSGEAAFGFCPLGDRKIIGRRHTGQRLAHGFVQTCRAAPLGLAFGLGFFQRIGRCLILRHSCAPHCSSRAARLLSQRISQGRSDTQPTPA